MAGVGCLLVATVLGLPVSTTHTRTAALLGVAVPGERRRTGGWRYHYPGLGLTFPGCVVLGWSMARFFLHIWK